MFIWYSSCFSSFCHLDNPINNKLLLINHCFHLYLLLGILSQCCTVRKRFEFEIACIYIQTCDFLIYICRQKESLLSLTSVSSGLYRKSSVEYLPICS